MNPQMDAVCLEIRRLVPLTGWKRGVFMFMAVFPSKRGFQVRLTEWRTRGFHNIDGPFDSWSFYVRSPEDVEPKLVERLLA